MSIQFYLCSSLLFYDYTITHFFVRFVSSLISEARSSGSIGCKYLSRIITRSQMIGGGQGCYEMVLMKRER